METIPLQVELRDRFGKQAARAARRQGKVPGVLYGRSRSAVALLLDEKEFTRKVARLEGSHLVRLESAAPDLKGRVALVKEMQRDPLSAEVLHADLYEVDLERKLRLRVPLHFVGKAAGVERGGILQPIQREVEVLCLPTDIPEFIDVDVSNLGIHDTVHVSEIALPAGVEIQFDTDESVVTVLPPTVEEAKVAAEVTEVPAAEAGAAAEPAKPEAGKAAAPAKGTA
jgi:large subunit ribosomal protein L25